MLSFEIFPSKLLQEFRGAYIYHSLLPFTPEQPYFDLVAQLAGHWTNKTKGRGLLGNIRSNINKSDVF